MEHVCVVDLADPFSGQFKDKIVKGLKSYDVILVNNFKCIENENI